MKMTFRFGLVDMSDTAAREGKEKPTDAVSGHSLRRRTAAGWERFIPDGASQSRSHAQLPT